MNWGGCTADQRGARGSPAQRGRWKCAARGVRRGHHHDRLPAHSHAGGHRGETVQADGADADLRAGRLADPGADPDAGAGQPVPAQTGEGKGAVAGAAGHRFYEPALDLALRFRKLTCWARWPWFAARCCWPRAWAESFCPSWAKGALVGTTVRLAGISVDEAVAQNDRIERV
jgi:hypothetical protein